MLEPKWGVAAGSSDIGVVPIIGRIVVMFPRLFVVMCGLVFGFAQFGSDPAFANGYHRKAGSCRGCNLPPSNVVNTHKVVDHTRVVHHTKVVPHTRVVNHDKLVLHKHNVHHRHTTIHKTNVVHREIVFIATTPSTGAPLRTRTSIIIAMSRATRARSSTGTCAAAISGAIAALTMRPATEAG
jgi:hypothetical protein